MANKIQVKRGAKASLPGLSAGEFGFCTDTFELYVGTDGTTGGNKVAGAATFLPKAGGTMTGALTLSGDPSSNLHAATKQYVDGLIQGINAKASVRVATTANITLSGTQTIDGIALVAGDRVLVKNQSTASQNGIYVVAASTWSRAADANTWDELVSLFTFVEEGSQWHDTGWVCSNDAGGTLETTAVGFYQFSSAGVIEAGLGLTKTGNTIAVGAGNGIELDSTAVHVKLDGSTLARSASGLKVNPGITVGLVPAMQATANANDFAQFYSGGLRGRSGAQVLTDIGAAATSHAHGNVTSDGKIGSSASIPIITGTGGVLQAGSFGSSAGTFCQGNDSRLSDARTPLSHIHGNITNGGAIGTTSGLPIITTTSGVLTTGAFGTSAGQFAQGNDSRFHSHSNKTLLDSYTQTEANLASAVSLKHSHSNKALLDSYDQTNANLASAVSLKHSQNTDSGTSSVTFQIGASGPKLKKWSGTEVAVRTAADDGYAGLSASLLTAVASDGYAGSIVHPAIAANVTSTLPSTTGTLLNNGSTIDGGSF